MWTLFRKFEITCTGGCNIVVKLNGNECNYRGAFTSIKTVKCRKFLCSKSIIWIHVKWTLNLYIFNLCFRKPCCDTWSHTGWKISIYFSPFFFFFQIFLILISLSFFFIFNCANGKNYFVIQAHPNLNEKCINVGMES